MKVENDKALIDEMELRALACVGAMALGNEELSKLILFNKYEVIKDDFSETEN